LRRLRVGETVVGLAVVVAIAAALRKLQSAQVQIDLPDLQDTLEALRKLRLPRAKGAA